MTSKQSLPYLQSKGFTLILHAGYEYDITECDIPIPDCLAVEVSIRGDVAYIYDIITEQLNDLPIFEAHKE